ncbi:MAG TPA: RidA family protein [Thermoanaerobaculia bacterium]|nr:RidA family protein [Thermoanaerobaculia bacterium]
MSIEARLRELGLTLSEPFKTPAGIRLPFASVRVRGDRAYLSGHLPLNPDGTLAAPLGKVGQEVTLEEGKRAAHLVGLAMLGSLQRELGSLDRITAWLRALGMVNVAPGFNQTSAVINGFSELIVEVFGPEAGIHARSAVGVADLPFSVPVEIEAEVEIRP